LVRLNDIPTAREYTLRFRPTHIFKYSDNRCQGYRIIARHYADLGDADSFFKLFKLCEPREERNEMAWLKSLLVRGVCKKDGLDAAVRLCAHKNIGDKFYYHVLDVFAEAGEYVKLKEIFAVRPELRQPEQETELNILAKALSEARDRGLETPDDFEELFRRANAVSAKLKWGDVKLRDSIRSEERRVG
jgi:hypothetical protein